MKRPSPGLRYLGFTTLAGMTFCSTRGKQGTARTATHNATLNTFCSTRGNQGTARAATHNATLDLQAYWCVSAYKRQKRRVCYRGGKGSLGLLASSKMRSASVLVLERHCTSVARGPRGRVKWLQQWPLERFLRSFGARNSRPLSTFSRNCQKCQSEGTQPAGPEQSHRAAKPKGPMSSGCEKTVSKQT